MSEYSIIKTKQFRGCGFMTVCKYNNTGDIIYIGDKDSKLITAIDTQDYNVIGTFEGHNGIVWNLDISKNDLVLITASGDLTIGFFNTLNGNKIYQSNEKCIPKYVCAQKNHSLQTTNLVGIICEALTKKSTTYIRIYDLDTIGDENFGEKIKLTWSKQCKPTVMTWLSDNELIIGCDDGKIICRNINDLSGEFEKEYRIHTQSIKSIVWNKSHTQILTGSLDCTAKQIEIKNLSDIKEFNVLHTYKSSVPVNYAIWNYNERKVILGGGIEAMNVAKTSDNDLNIKIYRTSDQKLTNHIGSHFGPIRYIDRAPNSKNFITASQDGSVKIYFIDDVETNTETNTETRTKLELEQVKDDKKVFERFGNGFNNNNNCLKNETNKMINLSWKPPKVKEQVVKKWVPGMSRPKDNGELYKINDSIDLDRKSDEYKKQEAEQNSTIRITNLPFGIRTKDLGELFDLYGRIEERGIKIKEFRTKDQGEVSMAFIKYVYPESAIKAIENMDGYPLNYCVIKVEMALQK